MFRYPISTDVRTDATVFIEDRKRALGFEDLVADCVRPRVISRCMLAEEWDRVRPHFVRKLREHFNPAFCERICASRGGERLDISGIDVSDQHAAYSRKGHDTVRGAINDIVFSTFVEGKTKETAALAADCDTLLFLFVKKSIA